MPCRIRRVFAAVLTVTLLALSAPATGVEPMTQVVPVPAGPLAAVTTEADYPAFPDATELPDGTVLVAYRAGSGHASADGRPRVRRSVDGDTWSDPRTLTVPTGYAYGPAGLAAETTAQGGRVYMGIVRYTSTGPSSGTDFRPFLSTSDDNGATWTDLVSLPQLVAGWSYTSGLLVATDGAVWLSEYVKNTTTNRWSAHYFRSTNRGATWSAMGVLSNATRDFQEPQMVQLADGRIFTALRSDSGGYDYLYSAVWDGTWSTPKPAVIHATGNPKLTRLPSGHIVLAYRGYDHSDETVAPHRPARLAMFHPDGSLAYRGNVDVLGGNSHMSLYGRVVAVPGGYRFVTALESQDDGAATPTSAIYSVPLRFGEVPSW
jgi:hypothetical protein